MSPLTVVLIASQKLDLKVCARVFRVAMNGAVKQTLGFTNLVKTGEDDGRKATREEGL